MAESDLLPPAPIVQAQQGYAPQMPSSLAAALMGRGGIAAQAQNPLSGIPLSSLMQMMKEKDKDGNSWGDSFWNGIGNWLKGNQWDGMAGGGQLANLSGQAAGYTAGGAPGL